MTKVLVVAGVLVALWAVACAVRVLEAWPTDPRLLERLPGRPAESPDPSPA
jgi:hypothetical protein